FTNASSDVPSLIMFALAAFVLAVVGQEFWRGARARAAVSSEAPGTALLKLVGRNRRRYGGYVVHVGMAVVFVGVAASSAFAHHQDVRLLPGQATKVGGYTITYKRPTAGLVSDRAGTGAPVTFGALLDIRKGSRHYTLDPSRNYYATQDASKGMIGRYFAGEANSVIAMRWGLGRTVWTAMQPDLRKLNAPIQTANAEYANCPPSVPPPSLPPVQIALATVTPALIVAFVVLGPLRRGAEVDRRGDDRLAALEAAKEAKYREIKDAELDHQMGKLSDEDYRSIDEELRGQAIEILKQID